MPVISNYQPDLNPSASFLDIQPQVFSKPVHLSWFQHIRPGFMSTHFILSHIRERAAKANSVLSRHCIDDPKLQTQSQNSQQFPELFLRLPRPCEAGVILGFGEAWRFMETRMHTAPAVTKPSLQEMECKITDRRQTLRWRPRRSPRPRGVV